MADSLPLFTPASKPVFSGEVRHGLDSKNRVTIPFRWRRSEADEFIVAPDGGQACLRVMWPEVFREAGEKAAAAAGISQAEYKVFERSFFSRSENVTADKQGRLVLPERYCRQLNLAGEVMLIGTNQGFQIWNPDAWQATKEADEATFARVAALIGW